MLEQVVELGKQLRGGEGPEESRAESEAWA